MEKISPKILGYFRNTVNFNVNEDISQPTFIYNQDVKEYIVSYLNNLLLQNRFDDGNINITMLFENFDVNKYCLSKVLYVRPYYVIGVLDNFANQQSVIEIDAFSNNVQKQLVKLFKQLY